MALVFVWGTTADPFDADNDDFEQTDSTKENYIHIRIQQRNGRKTLTTLQGLSPGLLLGLMFQGMKLMHRI